MLGALAGAPRVAVEAVQIGLAGLIPAGNHLPRRHRQTPAAQGIDVQFLVAAVGFVTWASASAPWWAGAAACGVGASIAFDPVVVAVGVVGFVLGLRIGVRRRDQSVMRALVGAIALNVLIRSELDGFLGLSAVVGVGWFLLSATLDELVLALLTVGVAVVVAWALTRWAGSRISSDPWQLQKLLSV